ncbi:MAG: hypothetical protein JST90_17385 [Bacteroidetes bacterium]|nr:hypothetical protein [Bacteroidota bacterium]
MTQEELEALPGYWRGRYEEANLKKSEEAEALKVILYPSLVLLALLVVCILLRDHPFERDILSLITLFYAFGLGVKAFTRSRLIGGVIGFLAIVLLLVARADITYNWIASKINLVVDKKLEIEHSSTTGENADSSNAITIKDTSRSK